MWYPLELSLATGGSLDFVVDAGHGIAAAHSVSLVKAHGQYLFSPSGRPRGLSGHGFAQAAAAPPRERFGNGFR